VCHRANKAPITKPVVAGRKNDAAMRLISPGLFDQSFLRSLIDYMVALHKTDALQIIDHRQTCFASSPWHGACPERQIHAVDLFSKIIRPGSFI
jgi:hypothetical protein